MRIALTIALALAACGSPPPTPSPTPPPTTQPTPPPPLGGGVTFPVRIVGHQFVDGNGALLRRWAAWLCCGDSAKPNGWPAAVSESVLSVWRDMGVNWTGVRVGPFSHTSPDSDVAPDRELWPKLAQYLQATQRLGMVAEVDILDGWALRRGHNYYGWTCSITGRAPTDHQLNWVRQVVANSTFPHVVYQVSNESFLCNDMRPEWELGIISEVRRFRPDALIATNSGLTLVQREADIITSHSREAVPVAMGKPTVVNEHNPVESAQRWENQARAALAIGSVFDLWRGELNDAQWQDALERMRRLRLEVK